MASRRYPHGLSREVHLGLYTQALMWKVMERFMNGPDHSTAALTLRDASGQVKEVKATRSRGYWSTKV